MPRRKKAAARSRPDAAISSTGVGPEKLVAKDVAPETILQVVAIVDEQSAAADIAESAPAHPSPPAPDDLAAIDRMLAGAESIEDHRKIFMEILAKKDLDHLEKERRMFWMMETLRLPRASMVSRYLHHSGLTADAQHWRLIPAEVYEEFNKQAPHHLSDAAAKHLKAKNPSEKSAAASFFLKEIARRFNLLVRSKYIRGEGKNRWLTSMGAKVFQRWPWWSSRDDEAEPRLDSEPVTQRKRTSP